MARNILSNLKDKTKFYSRREKWNKVVTAMAAVVVFCTTYALILPAITLETDYLCGMEEHKHTEDCYDIPMELTCQSGGDVIVLHTHNEFCYDAEHNLICTLAENKGHRHGDSCYAPVEAEKEPVASHEHSDECYEKITKTICGLEESEGHTHTEACEATREKLVCSLEENHVHGEGCTESRLICSIPESHEHGDGCYEENLICDSTEEGHEHGPECYGEPTLVCDTPESHTHEDGCYEIVPICQIPEGHVHGDGCFETETYYACGLEESQGHAHSEDCYETQENLICGDSGEEEPEAPVELELICTEEELYPHLHTDECYNEAGELICPLPQVIVHNHTADCLTPVPGAEAVPVCGLEEHEHTEGCRIDQNADLETPEMWEATLPKITTDNWSDALLTIARSQLGYQESVRNYVIDEATNQPKGYTRYGQWAGNPYEDWCDYFIAFCRHYAGIPAEAFPQHPGQPQWCAKLQEENWGIYLPSAEYTPGPGDTVYFDMDCNGALDHVGIVEELIPETEEEPAKIQTIEGNSSNRVQRVKYNLDAQEILGYASLANARERWELLHPEDFPKTYYCGLTEHQHTDECKDPETGDYVCGLTEHTHDEGCEVEPKTYYCGLSEHQHTDECKDPETGDYVCGPSEHTHDESCEVEPKTYYCGLTEHQHTDECKDPETGDCVCGLTEHTHDESCEVEPKTYYCGLSEHQHTDECKDLETGDYVCGLTEHTHDESCETEPKTYYCGLTEHQHTDECKDPETGDYICGLTEHTHDESCEVEPKTYYCGLTEHQHTDECKDPETGDYVCGLTEHTHDERCEVEPKTYYCGLTEHEHTDACVDPETGDYICGLEAHTHTPACEMCYYCGKAPHTHAGTCYDEEGNLICTIPEHTHTEACEIPPVYYCGKEAHIHGPACYDAEKNLICTLEEHTHEDACLVEPQFYCGLTQHTHIETCYDETGALICPLIQHTHDEECALEFLCGLPEHTHSPECSDIDGNLICTVTPHTHNEICKLKKQTVKASIYRDGTYEVLDTEDPVIINVSGPMPRYVQVKAYPIQLQIQNKGVLAAYDIALFDIYNQDFQPVEPVKVTFQFPELEAFSEEELDVIYVPEGAESPSAELPATADEEGEHQSIPIENVEVLDTSKEADDTLSFQAGHFSDYAVTFSLENECPPECELDGYLREWEDCTGTNPFGTAQQFNLFLLGNMENWGVVHGNAAIMGNITGTNMGVSYDEGSSQNYAADKTEHFPLGLVLGGKNNATSLVTVRNGTVIAHPPGADNDAIDMDRGLDTDHLHIVNDDGLDVFFTNATRDNGEHVGVNLNARNEQTYNYCMGDGPASTGNLGRILENDKVVGGEYDSCAAEHGIISRDDGDLILEGTNDFFNVFNIPASKLANGGGMRNIYLCVPYGSYTLINVTNDVDGSLTDFYPMLRYQDSNGEWIQQPAKHSMANYTQTQRTLMNFDPTITNITTAQTSGVYVYSSILAPQVSFHAYDQTNLHGTIVLKNMDSNGKSAIIDNPFMIGSKLIMKKDVVCDDSDVIGDCTIQKEEGWKGYYADVTLNSVHDASSETIVATIEGLALNNAPKTIHGLTPGRYIVAEEAVYRLVNGQKVYIESNTGLWHYKSENGQKTYLDENLNEVTIDQAKEDPIFGEHLFNRATFGTFDGNELHDNEKRILEVTPGLIGNILITNHYEKVQTERHTVQKSWMEHGYYIDENGVKWPYDFTVTPPPGASVLIQLKYSGFGFADKDIPTDGPFAGIESVIELDASNNWSYTWTGLPAHDPNVKEWTYTYSAVELEGWDGFTPGEGVDNNDDGIQTFTNWRNMPDAGTLQVKKEWYDTNGKKLDCTSGDANSCHSAEEHPASVDVTLYKRTGTTKPKEVGKNYPQLTIKMDGHDVPINDKDAELFYSGSKLYVTVDYWYSGKEVYDGDDLSRPAFDIKVGASKVNYKQYTYTDADKDYVPGAGGDWFQPSKLVFELNNQLMDAEITIKRVPRDNEKYPYTVIYSTPSNTANGIVTPPTAGCHEEARDLYTDWTPFKAVETIQLSKANNWTHPWQNLDTTGPDGIIQYFVFETVPTDYQQTYRVDGIKYPGALPTDDPVVVPGMTEGFINIENRPNPTGPELPMTGSIGSTPYTFGGLVTAAIAGILLQYSQKKRRKEDSSP